MSASLGAIIGGIASSAMPAIGSIFGTKMANDSSERIRSEDRALQLATLKNQIKWRVADARAAHISPLAALGMAPYSYQPSYAGDSGLSEMGYNVGKSVANMIDSKRMAEAEALKIEEQKLKNEGLRIDNANKLKIATDKIGPFGTLGQSTDIVDWGPTQENFMSSPGIEAGAPGLLKYSSMPDGGFLETYSQSGSQQLEEDPLSKSESTVRRVMNRFNRSIWTDGLPQDVKSQMFRERNALEETYGQSVRWDQRQMRWVIKKFRNAKHAAKWDQLFNRPKKGYLTTSQAKKKLRQDLKAVRIQEMRKSKKW